MIKKILLSIFALTLILAGCSGPNDPINTQTVMDASRTQNALITDIVMNAQPILKYFFTKENSVFSETQIRVHITEEIANTQDAIRKLESYQQPPASLKKVKSGITALVNYKSSLTFLRTALENGKENMDQEMQQFLSALSILQSSFYIKP